MAPPSAASAQQSTRRHAGADASAPRRSALRAPLRLVATRRRVGTPTTVRAGRQGRVLYILAVSLVVGTLLAVVVAQAILANGQVTLSGLQHQLALEQSLHRQGELAVSQLETPSRIVGSASTQLHMVRPAGVTELPYVSLSVPLPTPKVTPGPTATAAAPLPTQTSSTGSTGSGSSTPAPTTTPTSTP
jgi:Tfp pilus assembly protein PilX